MDIQILKYNFPFPMYVQVKQQKFMLIHVSHPHVCSAKMAYLLST